jgi:hypothetical protein
MWATVCVCVPFQRPDSHWQDVVVEMSEILKHYKSRRHGLYWSAAAEHELRQVGPEREHVVCMQFVPPLDGGHQQVLNDVNPCPGLVSHRAADRGWLRRWRTSSSVVRAPFSAPGVREDVCASVDLRERVVWALLLAPSVVYAVAAHSQSADQASEVEHRPVHGQEPGEVERLGRAFAHCGEVREKIVFGHAKV